jgi:beta-lactamase regulating signal transducer with metallopeptidase domain
MINDIVASLLNAAWQGAVLFGVVWSLVRFARRSSASTRYALWFAVLIATAALPAIDFAVAATRSAISVPAVVAVEPTIVIEPNRSISDSHVSNSHSRSAHSSVWVLGGISASQPVQPSIAATASRPSLPTVALERVTSLFGAIVSGLQRYAFAIFIAWSIGGALLLVRLLLSFARLVRIKRALVPYRDSAILSLTEGSRRPVTLGVSSELSMPCLLGFSQPVIALPADLVEDLPTADLVRIVRHEHAHVRRWDDIGNAVQQIVKSVFWLSPAMHLICRTLDIEREIACDDFAVVPLDERVQYAKCLTHLAVDAFERARPLPAPCLFFNRKQLLVRVERLLERGHNGATSIARHAGYGVAVLAIAVFAVARFQLPVIAAAPVAPPPVALAPIVPERSDLTLVAPAPIALTPVIPLHVRTAHAAPLARYGIAPAISRVAPQPGGVAASTAAISAAAATMFTATHATAMAMARHFASNTAPLVAIRVAMVANATAPIAIADGHMAAEGRMASSTSDLLDALSKAGYPTLPVDDLIRLKDVGVTGDLVSAAVAYGGSRPSADLLVRLASVGVDGTYLRSLPNLGISHMDLDAVVRMKSIGIDPAYIRDMDAVLKARPTIDDLVRLRSVGVDPGYVRNMNAALNTTVTIEDLVRLQSEGLDPGFVRDVYSALNARPALDDLIRLRAVGMDPAYIRDMDSALNVRLSLDDLVRLRSIGVDGGYVRSFQVLGYNKLSADDLIRLRSVGVDADYVRMLRSKGIGGSTQLSVDDLVRLRSAGV